MRDVIADSVEMVGGAQSYDALVAVVGCDKNIPGALLGISRLNRPGIIVYGVQYRLDTTVIKNSISSPRLKARGRNWLEKLMKRSFAT